MESPDAGKISEDNTGELWTSTIFDPAAAGHALGRSTIISYSVCSYIFSDGVVNRDAMYG